MTWTDAGHGTQTAVIGTEHTLLTDTNNATFEGAVDVSNLANGETVEVRVKRKILTGGSAIQTFIGSATGGMSPNLSIQIPPTPSPFSISVTLKQLNGTGRNFDWEVSRV